MEMMTGSLTHQWIVQQGYNLFKNRFGATELDNYIGSVQEYLQDQYPTKQSVIQGVYDEDINDKRANPFSYAGTVHPSLGHFWVPKKTIAVILTMAI